MESGSTGFDWIFFFQWIMATTFGWFIGQILLPALAFPLAGAMIGILQGLVLRNEIKKVWHWALATTLAWFGGWLLVILLWPQELEAFGGLLLGLTTGLAQWLILRRLYHWNGWWVPISVVSWQTGLGLVPGLFSTGTVGGVISGIALELLRRNPKPVHPDGD